jgi:hypothetical protein
MPACGKPQLLKRSVVGHEFLEQIAKLVLSDGVHHRAMAPLKECCKIRWARLDCRAV